MQALDLSIRHLDDVVMARQQAKQFAARLPFSVEDLARIELAVAELASNLVKHARGGKLLISRLEKDGRRGVAIVASDKGPGIANLGDAMRDGFSTAGSFGDGLGAVREHVDRFDIWSEPGVGTRVEVEKWLT
ncbi:MAG: serine/threonine protein kinase [Cyanobacteria bacterium RYN_339]|nr:serine/threonine protein kinase [Cyanobacteria bacterium RYN_339]